MSDYQDVRTITTVKKKKDENKIKRWVVNPIKGLASWEIKDSKKKRLEA